MPNMIVDDIIIVTLKGTLFGQVTMNTFGYKLQTLTAARTVDAFAFELQDKLNAGGSFVAEYRAITPQDHELDEMWIQNIRPTRYAKNVFVIGQTGTNDANTTVTNVSATITKRGPLANKRNIGSVHIPISPQSAGVVNGKIGQPLLGDLLVFADSMSEDVELFGDGTLVIPVIINALGQFPPAPYENAFPQTTVRVSRRRTVGLGI